MPRKVELTFQKGTKGRAGRWKKFYRGKVHYLGQGRCKSDVESYKAALAKWRKLKPQLDAEAIREPKPHERQYDEVINEWELVLSWAVQHGEEAEAVLAREKLAELRSRREAGKPPPITHSNRLWSRFRPDQKVLQDIGEMAAASLGQADLEEFREALKQRPAGYLLGASAGREAAGDVHPLQREQIQWQDLIESQEKAGSAEDDQTLGGWITVYLARQYQRVDAEDLTAGRVASLKAALDHFRDWAGPKTLVSTITGQTLTRFHAHQLELISGDQCSTTYARDRVAAVRSLIRWLWQKKDKVNRQFESSHVRRQERD